MKISTLLNYADDPVDLVRQVRDLEAAGVDTVWIAEAYSFDAVSLLGYLAASTETIGLGSAILNVYSRTPAALAQTAAGLDALSGGRFELGIGASGPQVIEGFHGVPYSLPLTRVRETIDICRMAWQRDRLIYDGNAFTLPLPAEQGTGLGKPLKLINHPVRSDIPIHVAALGPKSVAMTAEKADGWLPFLFIPERADQVWGDDLDRGRAKRNAELGPLEVIAGGLLSIGSGVESVREFARPMVALYVGGMGARGKNFYNELACKYGFEGAAKSIQDLYLDGHKKEAAAAVPDAMLEGPSLCGDEGYIRDKVAAFAAAGVTSLNVTAVGPNPAQQLGRLREIIG